MTQRAGHSMWRAAVAARRRIPAKVSVGTLEGATLSLPNAESEKPRRSQGYTRSAAAGSSPETTWR